MKSLIFGATGMVGELILLAAIALLVIVVASGMHWLLRKCRFMHPGTKPGPWSLTGSSVAC